ncbi:hypothetical protein QC334_17455 [Streptomyces sp. DH18]|uniref:hypothetical protein n=1 Tax=Streptomyces sp. DH18 TaxID=3040126 RepID=UPI002441322D|nr:hypothetical protein [Streptomyces sp. DH18]MDG9684485.1 hypothetical protein [Streptomyces sp. DH18]
MDTSPETAADVQPVRRHRIPVAVVVVLVLLACVAATIGVVSCAADDVSSDLADQEMICC